MNRPLDKREALVGAAQAALIAGDGEFEIGEVARQAGVSVGLAYHHFGSKTGLVAAVLTRFYDRYDGIIVQDMGRGRPWLERERERLVSVASFLFSDPIAPLVLGSMSNTLEVARIEDERRAAIIAGAARLIALGQEKGEIDDALDPAVSAAIYVGGLREAFTRWLTAKQPLDAETFVARTWPLFERAFAGRSR